MNFLTHTGVEGVQGLNHSPRRRGLGSRAQTRIRASRRVPGTARSASPSRACRGSRDPRVAPRVAALADALTAWKAKGPQSGPVFELRGKDSNLDYLIQSQASYR